MLRALRVLCFALTLALCGDAAADKPADPPGPLKERQVTQPFLLGIVGSWTSEGNVQFGTTCPLKGRATFQLGLDGTAVFFDHEIVVHSPSGQEYSWHSHWVLKTPDGKKLGCWEFGDDHSGPTVYEGQVTDDGFDVSRSWTRRDGSLEVVHALLKRTGDGLSFVHGASTESLKRPKAK